MYIYFGASSSVLQLAITADSGCSTYIGFSVIQYWTYQDSSVTVYPYYAFNILLFMYRIYVSDIAELTAYIFGRNAMFRAKRDSMGEGSGKKEENLSL